MHKFRTLIEKFHDYYKTLPVAFIDYNITWNQWNCLLFLKLRTIQQKAIEKINDNAKTVNIEEETELTLTRRHRISLKWFSFLLEAVFKVLYWYEKAIKISKSSSFCGCHCTPEKVREEFAEIGPTRNISKTTIMTKDAMNVQEE